MTSPARPYRAGCASLPNPWFDPFAATPAADADSACLAPHRGAASRRSTQMTLAVVERHRQVDVGEVTLHWTDPAALPRQSARRRGRRDVAAAGDFETLARRSTRWDSSKGGVCDNRMARGDRLHRPAHLSSLPPTPGQGSPSAGAAGAAARRAADPGRVPREPAQSHHRRRALAVQPAGPGVRLVGAGVAPDDPPAVPRVGRPFESSGRTASPLASPRCRSGGICGLPFGLGREEADEMPPGDVERGPRLGKAGRDPVDRDFDLLYRRFPGSIEFLRRELLDRGAVSVPDSLLLHPTGCELLAHACAVRRLQRAILGLR